MAYNPAIHHRRSIRLKGYDYSQAGLYFITICCEYRTHRFGKIENSEMKLNEFGNIAYNQWIKLAERFANFELDVFQIMPDHIHCIILLNKGEGATVGATPTLAPTMGDIVGAYKSLVFNECLKTCKLKNEIMGKLWQRNYYEIIIRDERAYQNIANYIINNPAKWTKGKFSNQ